MHKDIELNLITAQLNILRTLRDTHPLGSLMRQRYNFICDHMEILQSKFEHGDWTLQTR